MTAEDRGTSDGCVAVGAMQPPALGATSTTRPTGRSTVKVAYGPDKYERLVALKNKRPCEPFRLNQNIKPTRAV